MTYRPTWSPSAIPVAWCDRWRNADEGRCPHIRFGQRPAARAIAGGGARGAAHVGVLKVLEELRVPIDCIAGTPAEFDGRIIQWGGGFLQQSGYPNAALLGQQLIFGRLVYTYKLPS